MKNKFQGSFLSGYEKTETYNSVSDFNAAVTVITITKKKKKRHIVFLPVKQILQIM